MNNIEIFSAALHAQPIRSTPSRIGGYDLARAVALLGMVFVNFKYLMSAHEMGTPGLLRLSEWLDGRPAVVFVVLAGIGLSLLSASIRKANHFQQSSMLYLRILKRAAFLFFFGLLFSRIWYADILHFYGFYFAVAVFLVNVSAPVLLAFSGAALISSLFSAIYFNFVEYPKIDSVWDPGFWTQRGFIEDLFANGCYPVFPWIAYFMFGIWLGRQNLSDCRIQNKILLLSALAIALSEFLVWLVNNALITVITIDSLPLLILLSDTSPFSSSILSVFSASGTALLVIVLSIKLVKRAGFSNWLKPFLATAQMSLTLYVVHIGILQLCLIISDREGLGTPIEIAWMWAAIFCFLSLAFAHYWVQHFGRGPIEKILRWVSR